MPLRNPSELSSLLKPNQRLLGLDVGSKTIGLALSDVSRTIATPLDTLKRKKFGEDAQRLLALVAEHDVGALVIGLPINMDGSEGPRCQSVRQFAANLLKLSDLPICFWDERLSTVVAERALIEADMSRRKRADTVDKIAAAYILQGLMDNLATAARAAATPVMPPDSQT
jgi:putative Holliday junction resolvase